MEETKIDEDCALSRVCLFVCGVEITSGKLFRALSGVNFRMSHCLPRLLIEYMMFFDVALNVKAYPKTSGSGQQVVGLCTSINNRPKGQRGHE